MKEFCRSKSSKRVLCSIIKKVTIKMIFSISTSLLMFSRLLNSSLVRILNLQWIIFFRSFKIRLLATSATLLNLILNNYGIYWIVFLKRVDNQLISFWQNETLVFYVYIFRQAMGDLQTCLILSVEKFQKRKLVRIMNLQWIKSF
jgi:hypothetical protein